MYREQNKQLEMGEDKLPLYVNTSQSETGPTVGLETRQ